MRGEVAFPHLDGDRYSRQLATGWVCLIMEEWFDIIYWDGEKALIIFEA